MLEIAVPWRHLCMQKGSAERSCHVLCEQSVFREPSKTKPCTWYVALCIVLQRTPDARVLVVVRCARMQ